MPMKNLREIKSILEEQKAYLNQRYGVVEIKIFGSYVRNEQNKGSDLDILVNLGETPRVDLLDLVNLERYLSEILDIKVDVAIKSSLRKRIRQRILSEAVSIWV
jgi:predicted nucleotidyltransferase